MAGLASPFSETGSRPDDPRQAELACRVAREGVTNTLRHAAGARCLVISLEHVANGSCRIAVRDDGMGGPSDTESEGHGTGLHRLEARVKAAGGTIGWGPDEGGWSLEALIPSLSQGDER